VIAELLTAAAMWQADPPLPVARSEVAGANWRGYAVVVGGFLADGSSSARVDAYNARVQEWLRLPDLPAAVNHPMAAAGGARLYVFGGYRAGRPTRSAFVFDGRSRTTRCTSSAVSGRSGLPGRPLRTTCGGGAGGRCRRRVRCASISA
jgi:hypothetical protein